MNARPTLMVYSVILAKETVLISTREILKVARNASATHMVQLA